ncbi:hypothetical protein PHYBLDRAFT_171007 [Phycomyces blakesleeanus NRRL 1555(-)]|uniref:Uncharacterized protein n=1 Tax=Phycomyces blakesleeanus (strain ATCC 8743b / DSM 1359 / FGSC 10004 / NBRC 33097 / NRRL 1555) TaxID=763407 RepID=A0A163A421_PHYB8|nr:hypothetical protein PHYBLDRAFT_171007 [Phycomyces blakesleeanus NRRL 1555(-)]OAD70931.1 hypothetical protein PHYBLDRAFT_171007 [Phycomyces blakesleeanus NRRL 1555(-)]|eukprot:XP_018288971.1 hypothetical protein PHYBLDRAFT_171007 [Phycomyces blakesleeanus NRRL 1555(-)]
MTTRHTPLKTANNPRYQKCVCERCSRSVDGYTLQLPRAARIHMHYYPPKQSIKRVYAYHHYIPPKDNAYFHNLGTLYMINCIKIMLILGTACLNSIATTVINLNIEVDGHNKDSYISKNFGSRDFPNDDCASIYRINIQYPNHELHLNRDCTLDSELKRSLDPELY